MNSQQMKVIKLSTHSVKSLDNLGPPGVDASLAASGVVQEGAAGQFDDLGLGSDLGGLTQVVQKHLNSDFAFSAASAGVGKSHGKGNQGGEGLHVDVVLLIKS